MKKFALAFTAVALGLLLASQAYAWGPGPGRGKGLCRSAGLERLNLTDSQKTKIEAIQDEHYKATRPLREKICDKSVELRRLWLQKNPDRNRITAAQKELRTLRDEMEDRQTALKFDVRNVLTAAQNEKLANSGWGRGPGFGPRGGMRGHGGYGRGHGPGPGLGMGMCF